MAEEVIVDDVSAAGIGIVAPTVPSFQRGTRVHINCYGEDGNVVIRRVSPTDDPTLTRYGVELVMPSRELVEVLLAKSEVAARSELEEQWNRSH